MATALIGLGSNLEDRAALLDEAVRRLAAWPGVRLVARSRNYASQPVGGPSGQGEFLNAAARLQTDLPPLALFDAFIAVEAALGRVREIHWGPRSIDLDLLLYDQVVMDSTRLTLPHPRMAVRRFVLEPAAAIAADMVHATIGWTVARLFAHLCDHPRYLALAGPIGVGKTHLARVLAEKINQAVGTPCRLVEEETALSESRLARFYANPAGCAWETELESLLARAKLLSSVQSGLVSGWTISDFWFVQSIAYADAWLTADQQQAFEREYAAIARNVMRPKLLVVLSAPPTELKRRIAERGRPVERQLDEPWLDRLQQTIDRLSRQPGLGPVLHFSAEPAEQVVDEVVAAIAGME